MDWYIARANIDHYISRLNDGDLAPDNRGTIIKMLIAEEDKLSHDLEQFEFAETRAAAGRNRLNQMKSLRDGLAFGSAERQRADRVLINAENLQTILEDCCHRLRSRINSRKL